MLAKRCGELENKLGESGRLLENANKEVRLLQSVGRNTDGEIVKQVGRWQARSW